MDWLVGSLRDHPELAFFLTLAIGYLLGRLKLAGFQLGAVTGTLLAGVLVGQLGTTISGHVKQTFFLLFLFSIGYRTGPQFFSGLKSDGLAQAGLTVVVCATGLVAAWLVSLALGFDAGIASGLIAGALTESATMGTAIDAIAHLPADEAQRMALTNAVPVAFAVTYLIGVVLVAWFLSQMAPRLMGVDLVAACRELEEKMGGERAALPGTVSAWRPFELRGFRVDARLAGRTVAEVEAGFAPARAFVERIRRDGQVLDAEADGRLVEGDVIALAARREVLVETGAAIGSEVDDRPLLDMPAETLQVVVARGQAAGKTLAELAQRPFARGVFLRRATRAGQELPLLPQTRIERGDVLTLVGAVHHVDEAAKDVGYADRPTNTTDMVFVGLGIVAGGLIGIPALAFGSLEIGLSQSVGVLLGGIVFGWLRTRRPTFGHVPEAALWLFESVGLAGFVAVVGMTAGPDFVRGLQESGLPLVLAGSLVALLPHLTGVLVGHHLLKMHPGILLGVCAGAGTATPALAAIQEVAKSRVPTLGYGVSYAVGNVLLALWGTVIVALLA